MTTARQLLSAITVLAAVFMLFGGCSKNSTSSSYGNNAGNNSGPGANEVWMQNIAFNPQSRTVAVGTTVTWTNKDSAPHTATSGTPGNPNGTFRSTQLTQGQTFSHTFSAAGTFPYYCEVHGAMMTGTIVVHWDWSSEM
jgi:plastocyanin